MAKLTAIATDPALEVQGVRVAWESGITLLIARMWNPAFDEEVARLREADGFSATQTVEREAREDIILRATARHVLLGWENVEDDDGKPMEYTPELGERLFRDPAYRDLYNFVSAVALDAARFRNQAHQEAVGN